mmetsp:Transcript_81710/g.243639  ORF Transcript_81710/g.243639 Transcript_81710/m.243639 type:complete len:280 (-) Transcript_81710:342-1181(-)
MASASLPSSPPTLTSSSAPTTSAVRVRSSLGACWTACRLVCATIWRTGVTPRCATASLSSGRSGRAWSTTSGTPAPCATRPTSATRSSGTSRGTRMSRRRPLRKRLSPSASLQPSKRWRRASAFSTSCRTPHVWAAHCRQHCRLQRPLLPLPLLLPRGRPHRQLPPARLLPRRPARQLSHSRLQPAPRSRWTRPSPMRRTSTGAWRAQLRRPACRATSSGRTSRRCWHSGLRLTSSAGSGRTSIQTGPGRWERLMTSRRCPRSSRSACRTSSPSCLQGR